LCATEKKLNHTTIHHIAIFASGSGSNAETIIKNFMDNETICVAMVVSNNPKAGVNAIAQRYGIPLQIISNDTLQHSDLILEQLNVFNIDWLVLAGFLRKMPVALTQHFENRIINIHPALLPKYGGKGMYGDRVHEAVLQNRETETGITIHFVNEHYDEGQIIFQQRVAVDENDTVEAVRDKVRKLEHEHFPRVIQQVIHNLPVVG
jgi:phosphoribosylglycinamide formyltransferase-1